MTRVEPGRAMASWGVAWPLPFLPLAYALLLAGLGRTVRPEIWIIATIVLIVSFASRSSAAFAKDAYPYVAVALGYDSVRYLRAAWAAPEDVIGCGMREVELRLFSVAPNVTIQDFFAVHHTPAADLFLAVPYTIFVYLAFGYACFLYFHDRPRMRHFLWAFAFANFASYALWLLVPTAPPWYVRAHGCAIDLATLPSPGGLGRVDALLGIDYFHSFYSRASSVFGAMPSMHCAYPMLGLLTAWRHIGWKTRPLHLSYVAWMALASVYFSHHWVLDVLAGWLVALAATVVAGWVLDLSARHVASKEASKALLEVR